MSHIVRVTGVIVLLLGAQQYLQAADRITGKPFATRSEIIAQNGMAATSHPLATQIALDILRRGGNAVDAAIAANAALGLMEPTGCGIGGDLFAMVWWAKDNRLVGLNASGRSPYDLTLETLRSKGLSKIPAYGPLPVTVPGCVDGWFALHARFGVLPMSDLLAPAIRYAREGFPLTALIAHYWQGNVRSLQKWPGMTETFTINGTSPRAGTVFRNPDLANCYARLATEGRDAFYRGDIARAVVAIVKELGGYLSLRDLQDHHSEWVEPVSTNYRGYDVWALPPNGQGIATLQILNLLEGYDLRAMGFGSADTLHTFVEAKKLAFADRARFYADPAFHKLPVDTLISKPYAAQRRALIDPNKAAEQVDAGDAQLQIGDTIYLTTADRHGNMVSLIQSNYRGMGSGCVPKGQGFVLQDRGELFNLDPNHLNAYAPHKRPFHTIIPAFVTKDSKPFMSFGVMGGHVQPQGQAQIIVNIVDFDMNLQEAGDAPRIVHSGSSQPTGSVMRDGGRVYLESGIPPAVRAELKRRGHQVQDRRTSFGGYQAIRVDPETRVYYGASESRKDGQAAGY